MYMKIVQVFMYNNYIYKEQYPKLVLKVIDQDRNFYSKTRKISNRGTKNGDQQNAWTGLDFQVFLYRVDIINLYRSIILWRDREG